MNLYQDCDDGGVGGPRLWIRNIAANNYSRNLFLYFPKMETYFFFSVDAILMYRQIFINWYLFRIFKTSDKTRRNWKIWS